MAEVGKSLQVEVVPFGPGGDAPAEEIEHRMPRPLETDLVVAMLSSDEQAFNNFFRSYAPPIYRFVEARICAAPHIVEEVSQAVMCRAVRSIRTWRGESSLLTWLRQIARNEITDHWRRTSRRRQFEVLADDEPEIAGSVETVRSRKAEQPEEQQFREELLTQVHEALDRLPANYGSALEWKYIDGESVAQIATRLGVNEISAQSVLARARRAFREVFTEIVGAELTTSLPFFWQDDANA